MELEDFQNYLTDSEASRVDGLMTPHARYLRRKLGGMPAGCQREASPASALDRNRKLKT